MRAEEGKEDEARKGEARKRYISTFKPHVKRTIEQSKAPWKTIGPARVQVPSPKDFLKKHSKEPKLPKRKKDKDSLKTIEASVPKITDHPIMGVQCTKNFISSNAANVIMGVAKKPQQICVDRRQGDKFVLETSGLLPKYLKKKDYGVTPKYVTKRTEEARRAQEEYDAYVKESLRQRAMKRLSDEERESLLRGLKKNWEEVHQAFQSLSVEIDTLPKKLHKERLETEMKQLEHDIQTIEKHKVIYIANK
ncbi:enkurin isoform X2 [Anolis carolinensis]|uniref:enkurin isoform X2 n=1 Tax=Anolis carolinensis TaxID=28377 RepID=UPI000462C9A0|nr:PREDICTED: enkurin isoform X2 [Anolis carolinensis]|eukprot:XP_008110606.1 PREDICTED: enkurin isoform X2 [Anolis carolinensis]